MTELSQPLLTIGQLAERTGVATSALRYWEELGLLARPGRVAGQRRYPESAMAAVGAILLLQDAGFTLAEQKAFLASTTTSEQRRELERRKLAELDEQIARAEAARAALAHAVRCPADDVLACPNFGGLVSARLAGTPLRQAHAERHRARR